VFLKDKHVAVYVYDFIRMGKRMGECTLGWEKWVMQVGYGGSQRERERKGKKYVSQ
jgi:hypothetical protein